MIGSAPAAVAFFVLPFMLSSGAGSILSFVLLRMLRRIDLLRLRP